MNEKTVDILGIPFIHTAREQFVEKLQVRISSEQKTFVVTANPETVMKANEEPEFMNVIRQATYVTADGIGIVKAAQLLNTPLPERVSGYDLMIDLLELADRNQFSIYLLGAQPETLDKALANIEKKYPLLKIAGSHHGFFDWYDNEIQEEINRTQPDLIFVALGVPRQENWIAQHLTSFQKGIFMGVGGSFDVIAGTVKRAPLIWQKMNLEWLYRLLKQPSRFGRMLALPRFVIRVMSHRARR